MSDSVPTKVTKAVVPAAGLGTRFLPATKATPKEMLPVVDKPAIQYVVEEAAAAGLDDVLMITGRSKRSIEDHFDRNYELEEALIAKGNEEGLALIRDSADIATVHYVRQGDPKGLGHAVSCAAKHVGHEPFAVLLGDDFIHPDDRLLQRMLEVRETRGGSVVALMGAERDQVSSYGTAAIEATDEDDVVRITDLVEKPAPDDAPSNWIIIGRYVCNPAIIQRGVRRPQLRHRLQGRLPAHPGPVRGRAAGCGRGVRALAPQVRRQPAVTEGPSPRAGSHADPPLVPVEQHLADVLAAIRPVEPVWVPLAGAYGTVLAEAVTASTPLPSFDNSAMDGYAVRAVDLARASADTPVTLEVRGVIAAGDTGDYRVEAGACLQIMTGARLPEGADAVVPVEWTDGGTETVAIRHSPKLQHAVRHRGHVVAEGEVLLPPGTLVGPVDLALLAASGQGEVLARTSPRVAVISTGNELVEPGTPLIPGQIWESNSFMLAAAAQRAGAIVRRHRLRDDPAVVLSTLEGLLSDADLLITSGGVSMGGEHDVVKAALSKLGTITFRKVAMQPGMPQGFGTLGPDRTPIFTLPGNPVSAYVSFVLFVQPALDALKNYSPQRKPLVQAALPTSVRAPRGRRSYLRGVLDDAQETVIPLTGQSSHQLGALAQANALIIVPEDVTWMDAGEGVDVMCLP